MSASNDILAPIHLVTAGVMVMLLRFLPQPWMQFHSFGAVAILGSTILLLGLLRLRKEIEDPGGRPWLYMTLAGTLVLLTTALWEIDRPNLALDVLWHRGLLWALGSLTLACVATLLGKLCRHRSLDRAKTRWQRVRAWSLLGLTPSLLGVALVTPHGSYGALGGYFPFLFDLSPSGMTVDPVRLTSWLGGLTWTQQAAFWVWVGLSGAVIVATLGLLWHVARAYLDTWRGLDDPKSVVSASWETSPRGQLSQAALWIFWAALLQAFSYSGLLLGLQVGPALFGKLLGMVALFRLRPLANEAHLERAWTVSWAGLCVVLTADVLELRRWEPASPWTLCILGGTFLGYLTLPTFCRLMRDLCGLRGLEEGQTRWNRTRQLALYGILPLFAVPLVTQLTWWWVTSEAWSSGWALIEIHPAYWPLTFAWEVLEVVIWGVIAWTFLRFLYAVSGTIQPQRKLDDSSTPFANPLFSTP